MGITKFNNNFHSLVYMSNKFIGTIIEESLENNEILNELKITKTKVEEVTEKHRAPWIKKWTLHSVEIPYEKAGEIAEKISKALDKKYSWYADFKTDEIHYIIYRNKVFKIDRTNKEQYDEAKEYGLSLGIPEYQVDFHPIVKIND